MLAELQRTLALIQMSLEFVDWEKGIALAKCALGDSIAFAKLKWSKKNRWWDVQLGWELE